jgi:DNA-binding NtrC family response regulator
MTSNTQRRSGKSTRLVIVAIHDRSQREMVCRAIGDAGFEVIEAPTCQDALTACRGAGTVPILIAEVRLPDMWGLDLARAATQFHSKTQVVCLASKEPKSECRKEIHSRGWLWLTQSTPETLVSAVQNFAEPVLQKYRQTHAERQANSMQSRNVG